jgi:hypothetical protein
VSFPATPTYWLDPTGDVAVGLRRYSRAEHGGFTCEDGWHEALVFTGVEPALWQDTDHGRVLALRAEVVHDDPRWPTECVRGCGYRFTPDDRWQVWQEQLYQRADTGEVVTTRGRSVEDPPDAPRPAPPGAMWDAWWLPDTPAWRGPDGMSLMVRLPDGHDWLVDGEASNCTRKGDHSHKCWVRHGDPRRGEVTVGKDGETCAAGAGSIQSRGYHGFLQAGVLTAG